eukprot:688866-Prymnesium_polylepis.2
MLLGMGLLRGVWWAGCASWGTWPAPNRGKRPVLGRSAQPSSRRRAHHSGPAAPPAPPWSSNTPHAPCPPPGRPHRDSR